MRKTQDIELRTQEQISNLESCLNRLAASRVRGDSTALSLFAWICILVSLMTLGSLMSLDETHADLKDDLVSVWKFDEGKGDVAHDSFGNNEGIINGAEWTEGKFGMALDFDGIDDGVEIPDHPSLRLADAFTVACWVYPRAVVNAAGLDHAGICWKGNMIGWGANAYNWRIATASEAGLTWGSCGGGVEGYFATANCFTNGLNAWYHVALVENGTVGTAYVNGVALTAADVTGGNMTPPRPPAPYDTWPDEPVRIGWSQGQGGNIDTLVYFNGIIDEVVIYSRALSEDEIEELMARGSPGGGIPPQPGKPEEPGTPSGSFTAAWGTVKNSTTVYIEEQQVDVNTEFGVDVRVGRAKNLAGFQVSIYYDPYYLRFVEVQEGEVLLRDGGASFWRHPDVDTESGTIVGAASTRVQAGGVNVEDEVLMTLTFEAKELGHTMISLQDVKLSNPGSSLIPLLTTDAFITISPPWDVVTDSVIDIRDMVAVGQHLASSQLAMRTQQAGSLFYFAVKGNAEPVLDTEKRNPDVDRNGVVDVDDLILVSDHFGEIYKGSEVTQQSPMAELRKAYDLIDSALDDSRDVRRLKAHLTRLMTIERAASTGGDACATISLPAMSQLLPNYPNPFNPGTWIPYQLAQPSNVTISIYAASGQLAHILDLGYKETGFYTTRSRAIHWDGRNDKGEKLASGVYFYVIRTGDFTATRKMVLEN